MRKLIIKEELQGLTMAQIKKKIIEIMETYDAIESINVNPKWIEVTCYQSDIIENPSKR